MGAVRRQLAILTKKDGPDAGQPPASLQPPHNGGRDSFARYVEFYLGRQPWWVVLGAGGALTMLAALAGLIAGRGLYLMPFYLAPVALVSWLAGRKAGLAMALLGATSWSVVYVLGEPSLPWRSATPYWNIASQLAILLSVSLVVSGLRGALDREKELARTDQLTGLPNSRAFLERLDQELSRSLRYKHPFTVTYLDTDNFKGINDLFGHSEGDKLLQVLSETVRSNIRATDTVARMAGDEFTLLLPETGHIESELVIARVKHALAVAMHSNGWAVTFSMGVVTYASPPPSVDMLVKVADEVMYSVKRAGKNAVLHELYEERKGAA